MKLWGAIALAFVLALPSLAAAQEQPRRAITMSGHGETQGQPDRAMLSAGVSVDAATAAAALADAGKSMDAVLAALKNLGVAAKDIQTRDFSVHPQYATASGQAPRVTGYQVSNQVEVRLAEAGKLGPVLDALVAAGANQIYGVNFSIRDCAALLAQARMAAVADARLKAETYAKAAGLALGPVLSIRENGAGAPRPMMSSAPVMRAAAVPVAPGDQTVSADVTITWAIK